MLDGITWAIIVAAIALVLLNIVGVLVFGSILGFKETRELETEPWVQPTAQSFIILSAIAIALLCLGRYRALGSAWVFWTGIVFLVNGVLGVFYLLSWPGLVGTTGIIGNLPNTASWFYFMTYTWLALIVVASVARRPEHLTPLYSLAGYGIAVVAGILIGLLSLLFEQKLPALITGVVYTPLSLFWQGGLVAAIAVGAVAVYRRYRIDKDAMLGYLALFLTVMTFAMADTIMGGKRYDFWWYVSRIMYIPGYGVILFGFLQEGYVLFGRERERLAERDRLLTSVQEARADAERSRAQFEAVFQSISDGIAISDMTGSFVMMNEAEARMNGYESPEHMKRNLDYFASVYELSYPDGRPLLVDQWPISRVLRGGSFADWELRGRRKDTGQEWFFSFSGAPVLNEQGEQILAVVVTRDITERRRSETERERLLGEVVNLARMAQRRVSELETILESIADAVFVCDAQGRITMTNRIALSLLGAETSEAQRTLVDYLESLQLRDHEGRRLPLDELAISQALRGGVVRGREELGVHPQTQRRMDLLISAAPLRDEAGHIVGAVEVATDITRLRELSEEAQRRAVELDAANKELEAFAYSVSHDLRAPLRHIDGFSRILQQTYADRLDERGQQYLQFLRDGSQKMGQLIDDLLRLSRVTRAGMRRQPVDLSELAAMILTELHQEQPERQLEPSVAPAAIANGDPQLLRVALENLLGNAWKFTSHRPVAKIEFGVTSQDGKPVYFVKDNGAGFDMAYADKLFSAFQRLHKADEYPGTGIGLATVQRIIHRHGGRVWAEGEVGKGATFYFTLA